MQVLVAAWDAVTTKAVVNCFQNSIILSESHKPATAEDDDPFKKLGEEIGNLRSIQPDLVPEFF